MYCELDKGDIIIQRTDGTWIVVQTDHRNASEIEAEPNLSIAMAIMRVLVAYNYKEPEMTLFKVHYTVNGPVPEFFHKAIASAGGILSIENEEVAYPGQPPDMLQGLNGSLSNIGREVSQRFGKPLSIEGLREVEGIYLSTDPDRDENVIGYWTAVVELGAFAGEVLRNLKGGGWNGPNTMLGSIPIIYECGSTYSDFMGKALKYYDAGQDDSLAFMVQMVSNAVDGTGMTGNTQAPPPQAVPPKKKGLLGRMFSK